MIEIQTSELKHLRKVEGITRLDRIRNQDIRNKSEVESI